VCLVIAVVEARAADRIALMIPAGLLRAADLHAKDLAASRACDFPARTSTSALSLNLHRAGTALALVAELSAAMSAAFAAPPAELSAKRQWVHAPFPRSNPTNQSCPGTLSAARLRLSTCTTVSPSLRLEGARATVSWMARPTAAMLLAIQQAATGILAREGAVTTETLFLLGPTVA